MRTINTVTARLFSGGNAIGTTDVQQEFNLTYPAALDWADRLGVSKIGASYAWTEGDVVALAEELEALEAEDGETIDDEDESDDEVDDVSADDDDDGEGDGDETEDESDPEEGIEE